MAKGLCNNTINKIQGNMTHSEHSYPTTARPTYPSTKEVQENDRNSNIIKMMEVFKKEVNKFFNEIK